MKKNLFLLVALLTIAAMVVAGISAQTVWGFSASILGIFSAGTRCINYHVNPFKPNAFCALERIFCLNLGTSARLA